MTASAAACIEERPQILGAAILLAGALQEAWQVAILAAAAVALLVFKRGVVATLLAAGALGVIAALAGAPLPH
jgi:chromate transporter